MSLVRVPVLEYHSVVPDAIIASNQLESNPYIVSTSVFTQHLNALAASGCTPIDTTQLFRMVSGQVWAPPNPVLITFDDGYDNVYRYAYPLLQQRGYRYTMFVISAKVATQPTDPSSDPIRAFTSWPALSQMAASGLCDVQSHTHDLHDDPNGNSGLTAASSAVAQDDLLTAGRLIEQYLGTACTTLCYPHGEYNDQVQWVTAYTGHRLAFTGANASPVTGAEDLMALPRYLVDGSTNLGFLVSA